ncbi:hypothetical protein B0H63DRAFT_456189 [Podospora didyma]|uniref:Uncharacterized protein n=1 Tax=Podospora didyma TaxID=330526 RepID=A0AAE0N1A6_9PEZI|nr:hypothetical protein B0H63DRAFT_456189 [Podospora didyma]
MDENGVQEGETQQGRVVGTSLTRRSPKKASGHSAWATILYTNALQPLDVAAFSALKSFYHQLAMDWVSYDIMALVAQQHFLSFTTTGLVPPERNKVLEKEGLFIEVDEEKGDEEGPYTPPPTRPSRQDYIVATPNTSRYIKLAMRRHHQNLTQADHARVQLLSKAGKALDQKNVTIATLQAQNHRHHLKLKARRATKRRTVKFDANETFASIQEIRSSQMEARGVVEAEEGNIVVAG